MPGWWEFPRPGVLVATLTTETVPTKWAASYRNLILPPNSQTSFLSGMPFDHARNAAAESCLRGGFEWLFFLDSDTCPPADVIPRLMAHGRDVVGGVYWRRSPPLVPVMLKYKEGRKEAEWITSWNPPGALIEVDLLGTGCMLVHRRVFERLERPWFRWELDKDLQPHVEEPRHSEDFSFCRRAKEAGFGIWADSAIQCEHIGYASSSSAGYQPAGL